VERILSSPTLRCRQTVEPLARDRFLEVEPLAALGVGASPAQVRAVFWNQALRHAILCTHGETIGQLLTQLQADGLVVEAPCWSAPATSSWSRTATCRSRTGS
jgi:8-oxo-dGTP diphosphatase